MELAFVFFWVADVPAETAFFAEALGVEARVLEEVPQHGWRAELSTGSTTLYLADERELGLPGEIPADAYRNALSQPPCATQLTFVDVDPEGVFVRAVSAGAAVLAEPYHAPWGQTLARFRTPGGVVVSLASPIQGPH